MNRTIRIKVFLCCLSLVLCIVLCCLDNNAYSATMRIHQPKIRVRLSAGASESGSITVVNPSDVTVDVKAYLEDWLYTDTQDGVKIFSPPNTTPLSSANWISFYPADFSLDPFASQEIFYTIKVPKGIEGGGRYAILFFETIVGSTKDAEGVDVLIKGRIGSLFYVEAEPIEKEIELKDLSVKKVGKELTVSAMLDNVGNVDITAGGTFNIIDSNGMVFARGKFNEVYTFPGDQAKISSVWSESIAAGSYDLIITLDLGDKPLVKEVRIDVGPYGEVVHVTPGE